MKQTTTKHLQREQPGHGNSGHCQIAHTWSCPSLEQAWAKPSMNLNPFGKFCHVFLAFEPS